MKLQYIPVETKAQVTQLAILADTVWHEYFPCILEEKQIDYMVAQFQSEKALIKQIVEEGYDYFFLELNGIVIGYVGVRLESDKLFLSKFYILKPYRQKGYAVEVLDFLEGLAMAYSKKAIYLTVNRHNERAISVYQKRGFATIKEQVTDIGQGYVMDDYIMELPLI